MRKRISILLICNILINSCIMVVFPVETVKANQPPNIPSNPNPANHEKNVDIGEVLFWMCSDPDDDIIFYDVYFGTSSYPLLIFKDKMGHNYYPGGMNLSTKYYWKIVAKDEHGASTTGPIWDFTTEAHHNEPPYTPRGPNPHDHEKNVEINTNLSFYNSGDPDVDDTVTYDIYFGSIPPLQKIASNISTTTINPGTLTDRLTYFWNVVAWDNHGASSVGDVWDFTTRNIDYNTLHVGGSGPGNYTTIQSAIDDTYYGDTVFVYSGIYYENVEVKISINLIGENKNTTIIDGEGISDVLYIRTDFVNISGFTIQNGWTGISLSYSSNSIISGNIASNNFNNGFLLFQSSNNTISGNTASNNENCGIDLCYFSSNNIISGNIASNNFNNGIWLFQSGSNNTISGNTISNNNFGIWVDHSRNNIISGNIASNNLYGILLDSSDNTRNIENNFINNIRANAYFESSYKIKWERNYWDDWKGIGPKMIKGKISIDFLPELDDISWINFDWHPAKEPYDIP